MRPVAADIVIFRNTNNGKEVLLIKRGHEPFKDMWALPGGRLEDDETIEQCAIREAKEETNLDITIERLIGVYSDPNRDPRKIVAVAFLCSAKGIVKEGDDAKAFKWVPIKEALTMELAADHDKILQDALRAIKDRDQ